MARAQASVAAAAAGSLALLRLDTTAVDTSDVSIGAEASLVSQVFDIYGFLDPSTTASSPNIVPLVNDWTVPPPSTPAFPPNVNGWPILGFLRASGSASGNIEGSGVLSSLSSAPTSTNLASAGSFLGAPLGPFTGETTLIMMDAAATIADYIDVYPTEDAAAADANGCQPPIRIYGGGGPNSYVRLSTQYAQIKTIAKPNATSVKWCSNAGGGGGGGLPVPVAIPGTPLTIAERNSAGGLQATSFSAAGVAAAGNTVVGSSITTSTTTTNSGTGGLDLNSAGDVTIDGNNVTTTATHATSATNTQAAQGGGASACRMTVNGVTSAGADRSATASGGSASCNDDVTATGGTGTANRTIAGNSTQANVALTSDAGTAQCNRTLSATGGTATANTSCTSSGIATSNTSCVGAALSVAGLSAAITGGATASAAVSCTADTADGFKVTTGATPTQRIFTDQNGKTAFGPAAPNTSCLIDCQSTTLGFGVPAMTTTQRDAIASPRAGLLIYNTSTGKLNIRVAAAWEVITSA